MEHARPTTPACGLATAEARARLAVHGPNALPPPPPRRIRHIVAEVLREPMFLLLVGAAVIYLVVGDPAEGGLLAMFAALSVGLVVAQQRRSERALEALRALGSPVARVWRDGREQRVDAATVVPGDLLLVGEGERIAADACLRRADTLAVDESLLTGESVPVRKRAVANGFVAAAPGGDDTPALWSGTLVVQGHGIAEVIATGPGTAAGRIGVQLATIEQAPTHLQGVVTRLVRLFGGFAAFVSLAVVVLHGSLRGDWIEATLAGIALAMAMLPEEFPMALAVFLALGAWRLAQTRVLVRRGAVIETLGTATVLAVDKTGTLTENRMRLAVLDTVDARWRMDANADPLPERFHRLLEHALLASKRQAHDPMDLALATAASDALAGSEHLHGDWPLTREYGLSADLPAVARVWRDADGHGIVAAKGAPEAIASLCGLDEPTRTALLARVSELAADGLRVLAVASGTADTARLPADTRGLQLTLEGLVAFVDPLRPSAQPAVAAAHAAGLRVLMITGDYPATATAIARDAGIAEPTRVLAGSEIDALDDATLVRSVASTNVYARIRPEQKLRIVQALAAGGAVVAMTGDGVNDAPALKAAHIGIAMAGRGTDVAREAAAISLLDDDFGRIVDGVRLGRRIFDNLRKVMIYIVAIHVPVAGLALLPLLAGLPPVLLPMHVVLIEMVVDPICSIAFESEPEEPGILRRPPRPASEPLIGWPQLLIGVAQGLVVLAGVLGVHAWARHLGLPEDTQRSLAFIALTAGNLALVRVTAVRGWTLARLVGAGRGVYWTVATIASAIVALTVYWPSAAALFGFAAPDPAHAALAIAAGIASALVFDLAKPLTTVRRALGAAA